MDERRKCNSDGMALEHVEYSSKSRNNFNHKAEWSKLPKSVTNGQPYNYYPRGRVEIKKQQGEGLPQSHFNLYDSYSKKGVLSD